MDGRWPQRPEEMPWNFSTVGNGHDAGWWTEFLTALGRAGYDGPVSIEWEDPFVDPEQSIREAARVLREAMAAREVSA
jgi:sugar phosphate isomerase/epimerase